MNNNEVLRRLRDALQLNEAGMVAVYREAGFAMNPATLPLLLKGEHEEDFIPCANQLLLLFLEGLIVQRRGRLETGGGPARTPGAVLDNNVILKKLRIALDLKEDDLLAVMLRGGMPVSKGDLAPLFHARGHRRYRECSDVFLQAFLAGIATR